MIENLLILPVLIPLLTAIGCVCLRAHASGRRWLTLSSLVLQLGISLALLQHTLSTERPLVLNLGAWNAGIGIVWVADLLSNVFLVLSSILFLATAWASPEGLEKEERTHFFPVLNLLALAVHGAFLTGDIFNLFVFFEIMLLASFVLMSQGGSKERLKGSFPYVILNLIASGMFLFSLGIIYASIGNVSFAGIALFAEKGSVSLPLLASCLILVVVFCIKSALVPWHFWLPDSYPNSSIPINALFAGLLTKVGIYALYRLIPLLNGFQFPLLSESLLFISLATMLVGVCGALGSTHLRSILSFHIISQVGYMTFGLGLASELAMVAGLFYVMHHMIVKSALFFAVGIPEIRSGDGKLGVARGYLHIDHKAAIAFLILALSLAGIPPLSGFWGKFFLIYAAFEQMAWTSAFLSILVSFFTLASMLKIWNATYWGSPAELAWKDAPTGRLRGTAICLAALAVGIGLGAAPIFEKLQHFATELYTAKSYVSAVEEAGLSKTLGEGGL